jgi:hypothetical protein
MPFTSEHDISLDEVFWHRWIFGPLLLNLHSPHLFELSIEDWEGITVFDTELDASLNIFLDFLHITLRINCLALCFLLVSIGEVTLFGLIVWEGNSDSERAPVLWVEAHIEKGVRKFSISHVEVKALGLWNRLLTLFACWLLVLPRYANQQVVFLGHFMAIIETQDHRGLFVLYGYFQKLIGTFDDIVLLAFLQYAMLIFTCDKFACPIK